MKELEERLKNATSPSARKEIRALMDKINE